MPASPVDGFFGQIAMFRASLDRLGGPYRDASVVVTFGGQESPDVTRRWSRHLERVTTHRVDPAAFAARGHAAQVDARWVNIPDEYDVAIFVDADTIVFRPFDDLLMLLNSAPGIAGTIAHWPFPQRPGENQIAKWTALSTEFVGSPIAFEYVHTLTTPSDPDEVRASPFYVNFGFVAISRGVLERLRPAYLDLAQRVTDRLVSPYFGGQIALALAVHAQNVTRHELDLRFNFPNDPRAEALYRPLVHDLRVLHYLRTDHFDRQAIFATRPGFEAFMSLELHGAEGMFQMLVRQLTGGNYPFDG